MHILFLTRRLKKLQKHLEKDENLESFRLRSSVFRPDIQREFLLWCNCGQSYILNLHPTLNFDNGLILEFFWKKNALC
jgi:hypothetical protein